MFLLLCALTLPAAPAVEVAPMPTRLVTGSSYPPKYRYVINPTVGRVRVYEQTIEPEEQLDWKLVHTLTFWGGLLRGHDVSKDLQYLAIVIEGEATIWDLKTGAVVKKEQIKFLITDVLFQKSKLVILSSDEKMLIIDVGKK